MALERNTIPLEDWQPRTLLGRKVKGKEITTIDQILDAGEKILEPEIVDSLLPGLHVELLEVGQSKGKFGGGKGSIWKQTQKKTSEGNTITFAAFAVVGNKNGYLGIGYGAAKETVPAREKAIRKAKLNLIKIRRGCGAWACDCKQAHSLPFKVMGKSGSVRMTLIPAPRGTGLSVEKKCSRMISLAGIKDVYSKTQGSTATKINLFKACFEALKHLEHVKIQPAFITLSGLIEGSTS
ncbi:MAG TPA: 30S ribosomal protein S5 [Candidatus Nanoarchaeia archaeon]|nr:30S ribosomal protein S5 [Candidatus Nanoarchaeia archaeon]